VDTLYYEWWGPYKHPRNRRSHDTCNSCGVHEARAPRGKCTMDVGIGCSFFHFGFALVLLFWFRGLSLQPRPYFLSARWQWNNGSRLHANASHFLLFLILIFYYPNPKINIFISYLLFWKFKVYFFFWLRIP